MASLEWIGRSTSGDADQGSGVDPDESRLFLVRSPLGIDIRYCPRGTPSSYTKKAASARCIRQTPADGPKGGCCAHDSGEDQRWWRLGSGHRWRSNPRSLMVRLGRGGEALARP